MRPPVVLRCQKFASFIICAHPARQPLSHSAYQILAQRSQ
jgi:hypothetical protein